MKLKSNFCMPIGYQPCHTTALPSFYLDRGTGWWWGHRDIWIQKLFSRNKLVTICSEISKHYYWATSYHHLKCTVVNHPSPLPGKSNVWPAQLFIKWQHGHHTLKVCRPWSRQLHYICYTNTEQNYWCNWHE